MGCMRVLHLRYPHPVKRFNLTAAFIFWWCMAAGAAPAAAPVRAEIDALLNKLQTSGCQFNRNGAWHSGSEARDHLLGKLEYIERKGTVGSAEQFIELAASRSSFSGKAYQVKCGDAAPVESRQWLSEQLKIIRSAAGKNPP
ncbi:MAG: DUF5329 domain-containing protein [Zoogloeaceae bacterium]|jgi:hypothetical protein|nr:DUF5329 domain-containing protein [Zoogloeaceae bacterium]